MCELLVMVEDRRHADPAKDLAGCYKRGDVVEIRPDGAVYGTQEHRVTGGPSCPFLVVKLPGISVAAATKYLGTTAVYRRLYAFDWATIRTALGGTGALAAILAAGEVTTSWATIRNAVYNKLTGDRETNVSL